MQTVKKQLSELRKTEKNIRRHSDKQIQEYVRSLKMFGQIRPLVVTDDGEILVGNGMYDALTQMGETECDVYVVEGLTEPQKRKLMLADNKVYEMGFTDVALLDGILADLAGDFDIPGYNEDILKAITEKPLEATETILAYGKQPIKISQNEKTDDTKTFEENPASHYEQPVKTTDGEFADPNKVVKIETENVDNGRPFVMCPKCGERIWL